MTMDYGPAMDMGAAAIQAANALHSQLGQIWTTKTSAQLWAMEGNTPMIGVNDTSAEVFTTGNATTLESFAAANGIQELSFWALGRDNSGLAAARRRAPTSSPTSSRPSPAARRRRRPAVARRSTGTAASASTWPAANSANGTAIQLWTCNGTAAQQWTHTGNTFQALGKCMDVTSAGTANGTKVQLWDCNGTNAQAWTQGSNGSLVNTGSGKCLDATGPSSADGTRLQIWTCAGTAPTRVGR